MINMNKIIYYLSVFLFSIGVTIVIGKNILDFKFLIASVIMYIITANLYQTINQSFTINFYSLISTIFIISVSILLWNYRANINTCTLLVTIIIFILVLVSHRYIISKLVTLN
jgi:hypothetical protein